MYGYEVKVRGTLYLWGSTGVVSNLQWPLLLILRNDVVGDPITIETETTDGTKKLMGTLQKGECYTLSLLGLRGVLATCEMDSNVTCVIVLPQIGPMA
jgi:hypothetical protein